MAELQKNHTEPATIDWLSGTMIKFLSVKWYNWLYVLLSASIGSDTVHFMIYRSYNLMK